MKKMTINKTNKAIESLSSDTTFTKAIEIEGEEFILEVRTDLTMQEKSSIIDSMLGCFTDQGYAPEYRDVIFAWKIVDIMTNLTAPITKDKSIDIVKMQDWLNKTNLLDKIMEISPRILNLIIDLETLISDKLEYQKQLIIHSNRTDELVDAVLNFLDKTSATIDGFGGSLKGLDMNNINEIAKKVSKDGIDPNLLNSLKGILDVGSTGKVDENVCTDNPTLEVVR